MPDFTQEVYYHCRSLEHFRIEVLSSKQDKTYKVGISYSHEPTTAQYEWHCECKGFQMRRKCRHIERAKASPFYCGWNGLTDPGEPVLKNERWKCPRCDNDTKALKHAV